MMQSCASAAKLRGGGPILRRGGKTKSQVGLPPRLGPSAAAWHQDETELQNSTVLPQMIITPPVE
jgi:hypothetical protein